jgi:hypothetical protein
LSCVTKVWDDAGDSGGTGPGAPVGKKHEFQQMASDWRGRGLDNVDVAPTDVHVQFHVKLVIREFFKGSPTRLDPHQGTDPKCKILIGPARQKNRFCHFAFSHDTGIKEGARLKADGARSYSTSHINIKTRRMAHGVRRKVLSPNPHLTSHVFYHTIDLMQ